MKIEEFEKLPKDWQFLHRKKPSNYELNFNNILNEDEYSTYIYDCFYCGLHNKKVECQGLFYCPNPKCRGPGVSWFNSKLKSYKDNGNSYSVDYKEIDVDPTYFEVINDK